MSDPLTEAMAISGGYPRTGDTSAMDRERERIFAERVAHIEANPLLVALSAITDLGTCGGRGGLQKAVDIASAAIEADLRRQEHVGKAGGFCPECGAPNYGGPRQRKEK